MNKLDFIKTIAAVSDEPVFSKFIQSIDKFDCKYHIGISATGCGDFELCISIIPNVPGYYYSIGLDVTRISDNKWVYGDIEIIAINKSVVGYETDDYDIVDYYNKKQKERNDKIEKIIFKKI
jgi:hypothetical protein